MKLFLARVKLSIGKILWYFVKAAQDSEPLEMQPLAPLAVPDSNEDYDFSNFVFDITANGEHLRRIQSFGLDTSLLQPRCAVKG